MQINPFIAYIQGCAKCDSLSCVFMMQANRVTTSKTMQQYSVKLSTAWRRLSKEIKHKDIPLHGHSRTLVVADGLVAAAATIFKDLQALGKARHAEMARALDAAATLPEADWRVPWWRKLSLNAARQIKMQTPTDNAEKEEAEAVDAASNVASDAAAIAVLEAPVVAAP